MQYYEDIAIWIVRRFGRYEVEALHASGQRYRASIDVRTGSEQPEHVLVPPVR